MDSITRYKRQLDLERGKCNATEIVQDGWCPQVWDEYACWPSTPAGRVATIPCPLFYIYKPSNNSATMQCLPNSTWALDSNSTYLADYAECLKEQYEWVVVGEWIPIIKEMSLILYILSIVSLALAIVILFSFSNLRCPRNKLHMNLFASFIFRCIAFILRSIVYPIKADDETKLTVTLGDIITCKPLTVIWQYFYMANSCWITVEGFYICYIIYRNVHVIHDSIKVFVICGWGIPIFIVAIWSILKNDHENQECWNLNEIAWINYVIKFPVTFSVLLNFCFFCYMVYILCSKMRPAEKTVTNFIKNIAILIPLFAAHYLIFEIFQYSPKAEETTWLIICLFIDQFFVSTQGFLVAIVLCYLNQEVRTELKRFFRSLFTSSIGRHPNDIAPHSRTGIRGFFRRFFTWPSRHSEAHTQDNQPEGIQLENVSEHRPSDGDVEEDAARLVFKRPEIEKRVKKRVENRPVPSISSRLEETRRRAEVTRSTTLEMLMAGNFETEPPAELESLNTNFGFSADEEDETRM